MDAFKASAPGCASTETGNSTPRRAAGGGRACRRSGWCSAPRGTAPAFTPTSGPGISASRTSSSKLAYYAEIPAVIFDIQHWAPRPGCRRARSGPTSCAYASHGDTRHVLIFPANPEECFYLTVTAFDLADRLQTPVLVLSDLDIGMNDWMCPRLQVGRRVSSGSRQDPRQGGDREAHQVPPLSRPGHYAASRTARFQA